MRNLTLPFTLPVAGIQRHQDVAVSVKVGDRISVRREPTNPYDRNACVMLHGERVLGYVPKSLAERLAASEADAWVGHVAEVLGVETVGLRVRIEEELHKQAPTPVKARKIRAKSGRELGDFVKMEDGMVVVRNAAGIEIPYPKDLVVVDQ